MPAESEDDWSAQTQWVFLVIVAVGALAGVVIAAALARLAYQAGADANYDKKTVAREVTELNKKAERIETTLNDQIGRLAEQNATIEAALHDHIGQLAEQTAQIEQTPDAMAPSNPRDSTS